MPMLLANSNGQLTAKFTIPASILAGDKRVAFMGAGGSKGVAVFSSQGTLQRKVLQVETSITEKRWQSPPPPAYETPSIDTYAPPVVTSSGSLTKYENAAQIATGLFAVAQASGYSYAATQGIAQITAMNAAVASGQTALADTYISAVMANATTSTAFLSGLSGFQAEASAGAVGAAWRACSTTDPLAQTFILPDAGQLSAIDLWFTAKGADPVQVDIRTVSNGFPTSTILASTTVAAAAILTNGSSTRVTFDAPVSLLGDTEYAFVVLTNNATTSVAVAELGKWDAANMQWVTVQPYTVGVLLSSSNALTWTAHQDKDMAFRLLVASYTDTSRTVSLGTVAVTGVTDLMLMSYAERPNSATYMTYTLTLPDLNTVTVSDGQSVRLASAITGNVSVSATLRGNTAASPVLTPGTQLAYGTVAPTADYITRAIPAGAAARVKVIFEAIIPSGASVAVAVKGVDVGDTWVTAALFYFYFINELIKELTIQSQETMVRTVSGFVSNVLSPSAS